MTLPPVFSRSPARRRSQRTVTLPRSVPTVGSVRPSGTNAGHPLRPASSASSPRGRKSRTDRAFRRRARAVVLAVRSARGSRIDRAYTTDASILPRHGPHLTHLDQVRLLDLPARSPAARVAEAGDRGCTSPGGQTCGGDSRLRLVLQSACEPAMRRRRPPDRSPREPRRGLICATSERLMMELRTSRRPHDHCRGPCRPRLAQLDVYVADGPYTSVIGRLFRLSRSRMCRSPRERARRSAIGHGQTCGPGSGQRARPFSAGGEDIAVPGRGRSRLCSR